MRKEMCPTTTLTCEDSNRRACPELVEDTFSLCSTKRKVFRLRRSIRSESAGFAQHDIRMIAEKNAADRVTCGVSNT